MTAPRSAVGWLWWPVTALVVAGHLGLGVLAVVEYVRLDWLASEPYELTAVTVVAASAVLAVTGGLRVAWPAARGHRALRRLLSSTAPAAAGAAASGRRAVGHRRAGRRGRHR
jgi:hypothetical protein